MDASSIGSTWMASTRSADTRNGRRRITVLGGGFWVGRRTGGSLTFQRREERMKSHCRLTNEGALQSPSDMEDDEEELLGTQSINQLRPHRNMKHRGKLFTLYLSLHYCIYNLATLRIQSAIYRPISSIAYPLASRFPYLLPSSFEMTLPRLP